MAGTWLIIPTYDEADNLAPLVHAAVAELAAIGEHRVLVVDDASPDGTGAIAERLAGELETVEVLHRLRKDGLGRAYLAGFERALDGGAELVMQMDADFSHDPRDIGRLIAAAREADLVLGSRYVAGGGVDGWTLGRRLLSRWGSLYARTLLGLPYRDLTGGFKCFRRDTLAALDLARVHADGYGFTVELTYRAHQAGLRIVEVPIVFHERRAGRSKMTLPIALEAAWKTPALRLRRA